jgi:5-methylcytosine-specific restriction endonuclease McrA
MDERRCAECGVGYTSANYQSRFCSDRCRWTAHSRKRDRSGRTRGERICDWCGHTYQRTGHYQKACSLSCAAALKWVGRSVPINWRSCVYCGGWYTRYPKPCGCAIEYTPRGTTTEAVCGTCGETFLFVSTTNKPKFCSPRCLNRSPASRAAQKAAKRRRRARKRGAVCVRYVPTDIFDRDGWRCQLCGRKVKRTAAVPDPLAPTIDHIIPLSAGGADAPANVQCAHFECNWRKSDRTGPNGDQLRLLG